eukprot:TRINITY_DN1497_c0_g1_i1.p1 TRINITY_DN1497_c0_g1~~TRINITY_DN1497_c0_g1_i1.p1  ORF type:complete len:564 (+),score=149.84 TRINITY_DN1497_c0_g1_i1:1-1692(+)
MKNTFVPFLFILFILPSILCWIEPRGNPKNKIIKTDEWVVQIHDGVDSDRLAQEHGYKNMGRVGTLKDFFLFKKLKTKDNLPSLKASDSIKFQERQVLRKRFKREKIVIRDPLFKDQWHLVNTGVSLNIIPAWSQDVFGRNVTIAIVDDGVEADNHDISVNYNAEASYDFNDDDDDPTPTAFDSHGTSAAGCAAAPMNSYCGVGVAPKAKVSGLRLIGGPTTDAMEAEALSYKTQLNHIFSCSWGPRDDGQRFEGPGGALTAAMEQSIREGRGGLGTIYVWASGNGRRQGDNCNYDGYANNKYTIPIGSVSDDGKYSFYSEPCAAIFGVTPSSGSSKSITTSDLNGSRGESRTDCTSKFGGTSASSPMGAGMIALMLEVNPTLTWRDVQHIIANSSKVVDKNNLDWFTNGGGYRHNHNYGFGLLSPIDAITVARQWKNVPAYKSYKTTKTINKTIPQGNILIIPFENVHTSFSFVEHIEIKLNIEHPESGELSISLSSGFGTMSMLALPHTNTNPFPPNGWTFGSVRHWGENPNQRWDIIVSDTKYNQNVGELTSCEITFYGH